jgi:predicted  nucleic acid-binding Zn-ribbon protein
MRRSKTLKKETVEDLKQELDMLHDELNSNELEQSGLRGLARGLEEQISKAEEELDRLDATYD